MAVKTVEKYQIGWRHSKQFGVIRLIFKGGGHKHIDPLTFEDYTAMTDILRNEKPVWYDDNQALLGTFQEPVGEEES